MKQKKMFPLWAAFLLDFLGFAAFFGVFMMVHYVGSQLNGDLVSNEVITNPNRNENESDKLIPETMIVNQPPQTEPPADQLDTSGDFGARFPERFLQDSSSYCLKDDKDTDADSLIRSYLDQMGYQYDDAEGEGRFIGLYHSHNIFLTVLQVDTEIISEASGNPHEERYFVYDIYVRDIENLYTYAVAQRDELETLISEAESELDFTVGLPVAVVNGDYWGNTSHCLLAERNGTIIGKDPNFDYMLSDLCVLYYDGTVETLRPEQYNWAAIQRKAPYQIWNFGPGLLDASGVPYDSYSNASYDHNVIGDRHPRTIFGYYEPGHYSFLSIDGRSDYSDGMTIPEAARIMHNLGCKQAYNMDGGDSSYAYFSGNIVRQNESRADKDNARKIYDIICIGEAK